MALNVSILVFLDQALKDLSRSFQHYGTLCFNPCFPGSSAESAQDTPTVLSLWFCFNPCFPGSSAERFPGLPVTN